MYKAHNEELQNHQIQSTTWYQYCPHPRLKTKPTHAFKPIHVCPQHRKKSHTAETSEPTSQPQHLQDPTPSSQAAKDRQTDAKVTTKGAQAFQHKALAFNSPTLISQRTAAHTRAQPSKFVSKYMQPNFLKK